MTREERKELEASKPLAERNFWKLSKQEKKEWCDIHQISFKKDILISLIVEGVIALLLIFFIVLIALKKTPAVTAISIISFILYLAVAGWLVYSDFISSRGLFIYKYWHKPKVQQTGPAQQPRPTSSTPAQGEYNPLDF